MPASQSYISPYLTHLVGGTLESEGEQYECLKKILNDGWLTYPPHDQTTRNSRELLIYYRKNVCAGTNEMYVSSMVCFCDIPTNDLKIHKKKYSRFGLAFDKAFIARRSGGPVHYVPKNATPAWPGGEGREAKRGDVFNQGVKECYDLLDKLICANNEWSDRAKKVNDFLNANLFAYIRCFDHRLEHDDPDNYYFEREWRILGSLKFRKSDVEKVFLPKEYAHRFREDFPELYAKLKFL